VKAYVVESDAGGGATFRVYVGSEVRAQELVDDGARAGVVRTFREIAPEDMPPAARENLERVQCRASTQDS
jgi:hypothetical protein